MTSKRNVLLLGALGVLLILVASSRTWVNGTVGDAVLQNAQLSVSGSKASPAGVAAALVGAAAIVVAVTTGRVARWVAAVLALLSGLLALGGAIWLVQNPSAAVRSRAASVTGRTGHVAVHTSLTFWVWIGVFGGVLLTMAGALCIAGVRQWSGLSSAYDAPATAKVARVSDWDRLSVGDDPTADDDDEA
ncbi:Trp biosynthesis-associated membrane protein [Leekyejoonella antrihumi]|uniref:Trp biosynthesis-associated membrane protein n=1 Tax=Leekyejoonella antrihumi TaxID=1660198 RepID=A0A563DUG6_9MICO|nr:Trp biosynthesis-associated membrane protein [Leekyejoonella antrihumi]TWP33573.1 hypothetical protein FGL98_20765 [Leekyejoonella antrihumi]